MTFYKNAPPEGENAVATSPNLWRPISDCIGGFDLDPAAGAEPDPIADTRYTKEDDGLIQPWYGKVWLNPPFNNKGVWYKRVVDKYENGDVELAVVIAPADTSTDWFHDWFSRADVICFLEGRDWYEANQGNGGSPSFSTMVGVWGADDGLVDVLDSMGMVARFESDTLQTTLIP